MDGSGCGAAAAPRAGRHLRGLRSGPLLSVLPAGQRLRLPGLAAAQRGSGRCGCGAAAVQPAGEEPDGGAQRAGAHPGAAGAGRAGAAVAESAAGQPRQLHRAHGRLGPIRAPLHSSRAGAGSGDVLHRSQQRQQRRRSAAAPTRTARRGRGRQPRPRGCCSAAPRWSKCGQWRRCGGAGERVLAADGGRRHGRVAGGARQEAEPHLPRVPLFPLLPGQRLVALHVRAGGRRRAGVVAVAAEQSRRAGQRHTRGAGARGGLAGLYTRPHRGRRLHAGGSGHPPHVQHRTRTHRRPHREGRRHTLPHRTPHTVSAHPHPPPHSPPPVCVCGCVVGVCRR